MRILFISMFSLVCLFCFSQELPGSTKQQLENLADATEEETEDDAYLQQLTYLRKEPMNLNTATAEDLQAFYFLTDLQIQSFVHYRHVLGALISIYELQAIPAWDIQTINKILPFVTIQSNVLFKKDFLSRFKGGDQSVLLRGSRILEQAKGYDQSLNTHYMGDRDHWLMRYRHRYKNLLQYGITADKDAGEPFFTGINKKGFDFYSFHLFARNVGVFKAIAIGDYAVNLGQGLIQWQSLAFKKSSEVLSIKRQSAVLRPYTSAGEFYFNRGIGTTIEKGNFQATLFASYRKISANGAEDSIGKEIFTSFLSSGLYRTYSEQQDKNSIDQTSFGGNINYRFKSLSIGLNALSHHFSKPLQKRSEPYNLYVLNGQSWTNASADYNYTHRNMHLFGEAAIDKNFNKAFINGLLISVAPKVDISFLHRYIDKAYQTVYGNAFTENALPSNESGFYTGISLRPFTGIILNAYADVYKFPWLKYRTDAPSQGKDFMMQLNYEPDKRVEVYTRYRFESKQINDANNNNPTNYITAKPRQNWRLHFAYALSSLFTFRSRIDMLWYDKEGKHSEQGFLIFTEGVFKPSPSLSANLRLQYFETDGYNSRIYAYENDVLYSYSVPAFFDKGMRYYFNLNYDLSKHFSFWIRWAQTVYRNKKSIGSGLDEIPGNKRTEIKVQTFFRL